MGAIQPVEQIGAMLKKRTSSVYFHVDGVQAFGKVDMDLQHIDMYTLSGHKIGGPKGIGVLVIRTNVKIDSIQYGGSQELGLRPGTVNVPSVAGITEAIIVTNAEQKSSVERLEKFQKNLRSNLNRMNGTIINSPSENICAPHILNFSYPKSTSALMLSYLGKKGIELSSQSACSSKGKKISRVIMEMSQDRHISSSSIRISISPDHSEANIQYLINCINEMVLDFSEKKSFHTILSR